MAGYKCICWKCVNACNKYKCIWVKTLSETYPGSVFDTDGTLIKCPNFESDNLIYDKADLCKSLGITKRQYDLCKIDIRRLGIKMSVADYLERQRLRKLDREFKKEVGCNRYYYLRKLIIDSDLDMTCRELHEKLISGNKILKCRKVSSREYCRNYYRRKIEKTLVEELKNK